MPLVGFRSKGGDKFRCLDLPDLPWTLWADALKRAGQNAQILASCSLLGCLKVTGGDGGSLY